MLWIKTLPGSINSPEQESILTYCFFCWVCSLPTCCWSEVHFIKKKKAGRKTFFINKEQTRICLIMSLARIKAVQGYFGWRFPTTVLLTSEITQINRHCPWMHFASSLKKIIKSLQKVSPALLPVSDFLPPQTVLTLPCESRFCFCLKELSLKT